ncbi:holin [Paenibacillus illinoisensis]|uniref:holin n=1 Tax=Paenibacillus illinoisensis TaxID=59845 RepID=UPI000FD8D3F5|nr:holin [Paenibacillus illinoisensis]
MTMKWWKAAGVRVIKTGAQVAIGVIGATTVFTEVDWRVVGGTVVLSMITSLLTSLAGLPEVSKGAGTDV